MNDEKESVVSLHRDESNQYHNTYRDRNWESFYATLTQLDTTNQIQSKSNSI